MTNINQKLSKREFSMELVYLWVDKYKNIDKQGFNFSPRFRCEYDYEKNELNIIDKDETGEFYPKNFFGDNINITAIVGENGSGKSSLVYQLLTKDTFYCSIVQKNHYFDKKLWIYDNDINKIIYLNCEDISFYNNVLLYNEDIDSILYTNEYNINQYLEKKLDVGDRYKAYNIAISFFVYTNNLDYLKEFSFLPTHIELNLIKRITLNDLNNLEFYRFEQDDDWNDTKHIIVVDSSAIDKFVEFINQKLDITIKNLKTEADIKYYLCIREFIYKLNKHDRDSLKLFENIVSNNYENDNFNEDLDEYILSKDQIFREIIKSVNQIGDIADSSKISIDLKKYDIQKLLSNIHRGFFEIIFFRQLNGYSKIYFSDLSSGEQKFIVLFAKIFYIIRKLFIEDKKDFTLFLDEADAYLHPNWQKQLITYLVKFIKNTAILKDRKFNIFITSHSPFILSDLPKENVIFLENGEQVDPFEDGKQTFGANIHTLLSHGFFMKDGLMGEFAKEKIDLAIDYLNKPKLSKKELEYCENIISIIGEPIIKRQLQKMLDSKRLKKIDEIDKIYDEIEFLKHRIEILRKNQ